MWTRRAFMLILERTTKKYRSPARIDSYALGFVALSLCLPFGFLSGQYLHSTLLGLLLGTSLFTYTILLGKMLKRQPPLFLKKVLRRSHLRAPHKIGDIAGLRLDFVGDKVPGENTDGLIHTRTGELQRILRVTLPKRCQDIQSEWLETFFQFLSGFEDARFQVIFPEHSHGQNREMLLIVSHILSIPQKNRFPLPPLIRMQELLGSVIEKLLLLGASSKILSSQETRLLISSELGSMVTRFNLQQDWRYVNKLGWEPSFRDIEIKAQDKYMELEKKKSAVLCFEQLPGSDSIRSNFSWLCAVLSDLPDSTVSIFITPWKIADPVQKFKHKYWQYLNQDELEESSEHKTAQMSFFLRCDSNDDFLLENELSMARKFLQSLGIKTRIQGQRQQQVINWRATLPCAQDPSVCKHLIAFTSQKKNLAQSK